MQSQNKLFIFLIIVVCLAAGYLYYYMTDVGTEIPPIPIPANDNLKSFENIDINFSVLDSTKYKALQIFGEFPVNPGATGKKDIFAPI